MPKLSVRIQITNSLPEPKLPAGYCEPVKIQGIHFAAQSWTWHGSGIDLIRFEDCKRVSEQLVQLSQFYKRKILRPVQACELIQLEPHADKWPENWPEVIDNGRIFFAGTIYTIWFDDKTQEDFIWAATYHGRRLGWQFGCLPVHTLLRKSDRFAVVSFSMRKRIPDCDERPLLPPARRDRMRSLARSRLALLVR